MHSQSLKARASRVIKFQLHVDLDALCLKEVKTLKINGLRNTFDQRKQKMTLSQAKCPQKHRYKSIQTINLKLQKVFIVT